MPLSVRTSFRFPLQSSLARREVLIGALWLLVPIVGWLLNMGHRIMMTHRMQHGLPAWPSWRDHPALLKHGTITFLGMVEYHLPAILCGAAALKWEIAWLHAIACLLWIAATVAVPGYMSHYCFSLDPREVFDPLRAMRRVVQGGRAYWHAWGITLLALASSFVGLAAFGMGFLISSVWFWQVAGFSFATVFTNAFALEPDCSSDKGRPRLPADPVGGTKTRTRIGGPPAERDPIEPQTHGDTKEQNHLP
ncbi:hypothetical protein [Congregicoccus parvus]|uniref:hypothetical protein n=1 Tax=Congregicoccus parvus TaxID=3081749 RepID=UPI003FA58540